MTVPLNPVGAALHAITVQGGFSTPAIEAFRILDDALRLANQGALNDEWKQGVRDTLMWIDEHAGREVDRELRSFEIQRNPPENWRQILEDAAK